MKITDRRGYIALVILFLAIAAFVASVYFLTATNRSSLQMTGDDIPSTSKAQ